MTNHAAIAVAVFQSQFPNSTVSAQTLNGKTTVEVRDRSGALVAISTRPTTENAADREAYEAEMFTTAKRLKQQVVESRGLTVRDVPVADKPAPEVAGAL